MVDYKNILESVNHEYGYFRYLAHGVSLGGDSLRGADCKAHEDILMRIPDSSCQGNQDECLSCWQILNGSNNTTYASQCQSELPSCFFQIR